MKEIKNYQKAVKNIRAELSKYIRDNKIQALVLGLSGGIDSALCAALAFPVCEKYNINLYGRSITIQSNKNDEIKRAKNIGKYLSTDFKEIDLTKAYEEIKKYMVENYENENFDKIDTKIRMGNIKARLRMIYLYELAAKNKGLVLSTDNYTEYLIGFWTLHGDVGDYGMIQNLWKSEVYNMAKYLVDNQLLAEQSKALNSCIKAIPTDGLGITDSDLEQIQAKSYFEVDNILKKYIYENDKSLTSHPVIKRHINSSFKRKNPLNLNRNKYFK